MSGLSILGSHAAGVVDGMVGMNVGEERSITTEVGDTWWEPDALRGVEVRADIKLNELFEWDLPEVCSCLFSPLWHIAGPHLQRTHSPSRCESAGKDSQRTS